MNNKGRLAEMKAANYLRSKGYCLLEHSYKSRFGEIDLIFEYDGFIVFAEVKARGENSIAAPREFVDDMKQQKNIATANLYMQRYKVNLQPRFDVIEVFLENNRIKSIKHLENAFTL